MRRAATKTIVFLIWLIFVLAISFPGSVQAIDSEFLLDRVIRWGDGTSERVQVGKDGCFRLNGVKMRLVGMDLGTTGMANGFFTPASMVIFDKELTYLESKGLRLIQVTFGYEGYNRETERYAGLLDLLYRHKMLVFPLITGKYLPNFGDLTNPDFIIGSSDSLGRWASRWCAVMTHYPNVVAIAAENELDSPQKPPIVPIRQQYTATAAAAYLKFLTSIIRSKLQVPVVSKLIGDVRTAWPWRPEIKEAVLAFSDTPCLDLYYPTEQDLNVHLEAVLGWLKAKGFKTNGVWVGEANAGTGNAPLSAKFSTAYIDSMFHHGAAVVCLWVANRTQNPACAFFDNAGNPGETLLRLAPDFKRLQLPRSEPPPGGK